MNATRLEMDYPDALFRMWRFIDEYTSRYALACVRFDFFNECVEATNGKIAVRQSCPVPEPFKELAIDAVLLSGVDLKRIARMFKNVSRVGLKLVNVGSEWFAENDEVRLRIRTSDQKFPNVDNVLKGSPTRFLSFKVDLRELRRFVAAFESMNPSTVEISVPLDVSLAVALNCESHGVKGLMALVVDAIPDPSAKTNCEQRSAATDTRQ